MKKTKKQTKMLRRNSPVMMSVESVPRLEESLWFVKEVGFQLGVKEWWSYGWAEWRVNKQRCDRSRKRQVRDRETGM